MSCFGSCRKTAHRTRTSIQLPTRLPNLNFKIGERVVPATQVKDSASPLQQSSKLIIAIDFGTTFTGVAYHSSGTSPNSARNTPGHQIATNITVIRNWPNPSGQYAEKTPSIIAYGTNPVTWGGSVKSRQEKLAKFKLGLEPHIKRHYGMDTSDETIIFSSPVGLNKRPVDITADFLTCVMRYVHEACLPYQFGVDFLRNQQLSYVLTVPAIWSDLAKDLTRQAATRAGIPEDKLELVTEPEAAALYCATTCEEVDLDDGDIFLVCDAGGGTVDLIAYQIVTRFPFQIKECTIGTGAACGAFSLDEGFKDAMVKRMGKHAQNLLKPRTIEEALNNFEGGIKRQYNPYSQDCEDVYEIPIAGAPDVPTIGLESGYLQLTRQEVQQIFDPVFGQILALIEGQTQNIRTRCSSELKALFLVGGLGSNQYLLEFLRKQLKGKIDIKQPFSGYSAIMRGAVLHGMGLNVIHEHLLRRSYGSEMLDVFDPTKHPLERRFVDEVDGLNRCKVMHWYACKGDKVANGWSATISCCFDYKLEEYRGSAPLYHASRLFVSEADIPPQFRGSSVSYLCEVQMNHRDLPSAAFQRLSGPMGEYYHVTYDLDLTFGSELEFKLKYKGNVYGSVKARYAWDK